jgi:aminopeptidase N
MKIFFPAFLAAFLIVQSYGQSVFPVRKDDGEAPDRTYDVLHYRIEVSFDEPNKQVSGTVTTTLVPFPPSLTDIVFDAEDMRFTSVTLRGKKPLTFDVGKKTLTIHLDKTYSFCDTLAVSISYSCKPKKGLYFVQPDSGYPDKPSQIWTQGEDMDNHFWFPCHDFPNDRATSEVIATVQSKYTALSNGKLMSVTEDKKSGTKAFHWKQTKPHVSYLIMLAIGDYAVLREKAGRLPLEYYVYPRHVEDAKVCFRETPAMINFFNEKIGFPYPWEKYAQVLIRDFVVGGMENTSATSLADDATVYDARARLDDSPTSLIAHELAHQWWGDVVTCVDWRHLWLNESFATYFDPLYHEFSLGRDEFDHRMYNAQLAGINSDKTLGRKPIVSVGSYGSNVYSRGAAVLHMLRFLLGDELFWRAINHYITKYQFQTIDTEDFKDAIEEATGRNLYWFFDQWIYKAGYPTFTLSYTWNDSAKSVQLSVRQTQTMDSLTGVFRMPVDCEIVTAAGSTTHRVFINSADTVLTLSAPAKPLLVTFDKGNWLLKEMKWDKPREMWKYQAEMAANPVDRLRAIHEITLLDSNVEFVPVLSRVARQDKFWAVRREAINAFTLVDDSTKEARNVVKDALLACTKDPRSAVRSAAVAQLKEFRGTDVVTALRLCLQDSSYGVVSGTLRALAKVDSAHALPVLLSNLDTPSHNHRIASAALQSLQDVDSTIALHEARTRVRYGVPSPIRMSALGMLIRYAQRGSQPTDVFLPLLKDKSIMMRNAAARALGTVGKADVIPALETIAAEPDNPAAQTAKTSIDRIHKRVDASK